MEISSSVLFTIFLAGIIRVTGLDPVWAGHAASLVPGALCVAVSPLVIPRGVAVRTPLTLAASMFIAVNPFLVFWSGAGMETTLAALLVLLMGATLLRIASTPKADRRWLLSLGPLTFLWYLCRPEAIIGWALVIAVSAVCLFHRKRQGWPTLWEPMTASLATGLALTLGTIGLRLVWFGAWAPNSVLAKAGPLSAGRLLDGVGYLANFLSEQYLVWLVLPLIFVSSLRCARNLWAGWLFVAGYAVLIVGIGGDWMLGYRFIVPIMPLATVLLLHSVNSERISQQQRASGLYVLLVVVNSVALQWAFSHGRYSSVTIFALLNPEWLSVHHGDPVRAVEMLNFAHRRDLRHGMPYFAKRLPELQRALGRPPVIMTVQMGYIPYAILTSVGEAKFVDLMGLTDTILARSRLPRNQFGVVLSYTDALAGSSEPARYVQSRKADLIFDIYRSEEFVEELRHTVEPAGYRLAWASKEGIGQGIVVFERDTAMSSASPPELAAQNLFILPAGR